ncbi:MAG TPA: C_GCAxxG_C_C family protein [Spirochaetales bacterium]|jgi:C_GCAxxG_C_C family probable redox protein|nr:C_GCAxxG_C_C family protein [Spirochaetales bacterium]
MYKSIEYVEKARALRSRGYNCAQAVACAFLDQVEVDEKTLFAIMEGFGGGMGGKQATCGAVSGAVAVLSLVSSKGDVSFGTKADTYAAIAPLVSAFEVQNRSLVCKDLLGAETGVELRSCELCIEDAVRLTVKALEKREYKRE